MMGFTLKEKLERGAMLPEGEYPVVMVDWMKTEAASGSPMIKVTWEVTSGEYAGSRIFDNFVVTDRGIFRACLALKALGVPEDTYFESPGDVANTLIRELKAGKGLKIVVKHRKGSQDQLYANVTDYLPLGEKEEEEADVPF
ncbi:MAG: hypothetical protein DRN81_04510 [Thermoproteota archaeon]|nr:MAG: hypothetical protein DRN81_04510 [Candidatus Korarchaeota archaeon]